MSVLQKYDDRSHRISGASFFLLLTLLACISIPFFQQYQFDGSRLTFDNPAFESALLTQTASAPIASTTYRSLVHYVRDVRAILLSVQQTQDLEMEASIDNWKSKEYLLHIVRNSGVGSVSNNPLPFLLILLILCLLSALFSIKDQFKRSPASNNGVYHSQFTRGIRPNLKIALVILMLLCVILYGYVYTQGNVLWPTLTLVVAGVIILLVRKASGKSQIEVTQESSVPDAWIGILFGFFLILFYIVLYWAPWYLTPWIQLTDPISKFLNGQPASQWFLYGLLYTIVVLVMGLRMIAKYRRNAYQLIRTCSVMFFQVGFAFLLPEILVRLNQPYFDFKNIWPLNYSFFFDWNINNLIQSGGLGLFMLVWGIILIVIAVPVFTYFYGKRWYCSWVCGCGGLAETFGDPFRQFSDKRLSAWRYERWIVHSVFVFAVIMTALVLYTYFTGSYQVLFMNSDSIRTWYGFLIGSAFAGVVGTGFYPMMGNRVWCRFGCPLAAYLGLIQRFKSRFRITVNGGQCISCGNCSTYCEMGIDVRAYAQRGQDIVRASCVGCGICASVCPRGVLRLENASDIDQRASVQRTIHIHEGDVRLLN